MIIAPGDYDFINWAGGDMPTAKIDGDIMPLRTEDHKDDLRGVDVAFLVEAVKEGVAAFDGTQVTLGGPGEWYTYTNGTSAATLTRKLSGAQIQNLIWTPAAAGLSGWWQTNYRGYFSGFPTAAQLYQGATQPSYVELIGMLPLLDEKPLSDAPTTAVTDFASDEPFDASKFASLFADVRKLRHPSLVGLVSTLDGLFSWSEAHYEWTGSRPDPHDTPTVMFGFDSYAFEDGTDERWYWPIPSGGVREVIRVPTTYLKSAKAYVLACQVFAAEGESWYRVRLLDLDDYFASATGYGFKSWAATGQGTRALAHAVFVGQSAVSVGQPTVERFSQNYIMLVGELNDRTKWW